MLYVIFLLELLYVSPERRSGGRGNDLCLEVSVLCRGSGRSRWRFERRKNRIMCDLSLCVCVFVCVAHVIRVCVFVSEKIWLLLCCVCFCLIWFDFICLFLSKKNGSDSSSSFDPFTSTGEDTSRVARLPRCCKCLSRGVLFHLGFGYLPRCVCHNPATSCSIRFFPWQWHIRRVTTRFSTPTVLTFCDSALIYRAAVLPYPF